MRTLSLIILSIVVLYPVVVSAQEYSRKGAASREIEQITENDIIFYEDYYYTAGEDLVYRQLMKPTSRYFKFWGGEKKDSAKVIVEYRSGLKIFNPFDIDATSTSGMDRPYAGWIYGSASISNFRTPYSGNQFTIETGLVGPASGMERLQLWVHKITDFDPPAGWHYQIRNEWVGNLYYSRFENIRLAEDADIVSQSSVVVGTGMNRISQDLTLRLIHFNPINNSAITQTRLTWDDKTKNPKREVYLFFAVGADYVMSNIFIQGSLYKDHPSNFTVHAQPIVIRRNIGITVSGRVASWTAGFIHLTKEVPTGTVHDYLSLRLAIRF